jgi:hypothetical protein
MAGFRFVITPPDLAQRWRSNLAGLAQRLTRAVTIAMNMAASMMLEAGKQDIAGAGKFGERWTDGLHVRTEGAGGNMRMYFTHDIPYAGIFETGGTIKGNPLLWIPLSGTDADGIRASAFPGGLVSAKYPRRDGGRPLLFAMSDRQPRYFGVESVTIPPKFQLTRDVTSVMSNFRAIFDDAWQKA